jgi:hypothetical protein
MDRDIQVLIFKAMALRHGFLDLTVVDKPKSQFELIYEQMGEQIAKEEKRKNLKIMKD